MRRVVMIVSTLAMMACGGATQPAANPAGANARGPGAAAGGAGPAGPAAPPVERLSSESGEGLAAAGSAAAYLHAIANRDWPGACVTRVQADRQRLAQASGSCERGIQAEAAKQPIQTYATATTGAVRKRGDIIAVDIVQPGNATPVMTLLLRREDGLWRLVDLPPSEAF